MSRGPKGEKRPAALAPQAGPLYGRSVDKSPADSILTRFGAALEEIYGAQLERALLYGSRARNAARPESDYDIAVYFKALPDRWAELDRLADLHVRFLDETGKFFDAKPYLTAALHDTSPLMDEIRREGLEL